MSNSSRTDSHALPAVSDRVTAVRDRRLRPARDRFNQSKRSKCSVALYSSTRTSLGNLQCSADASATVSLRSVHH